ncbi:MBL fold metallo-hydrolase [Falsibacillus albus]|uniref:MBL fold metallo-hydrolase n=1 Tax=Falsibacillus albus TaxID=2478915 RepID=A0A3L7K4T5_9BACI|nr:MBL fold metallo-hydrolase [Falsibacillus albus]RLQ97274.1 MBL fold metallo-hydrolase [Falsibacillus albus]
MKLTVIGQWGGYPKQNEASSGYLLSHNGFHMLLDCGSAVLSQLQNYLVPEELDAVILSHYHPDHTADIGVLQHALLIQKFLGKTHGTLPIYAHNEDLQGFDMLNYKDITKGCAYNPEGTLNVGPFSIRFLKTKHPVPCYAMRMEVDGKSLVYTADSAFLEEFVPFAEGADVLLCECNFYGDMDGSGAGHMTSLDAGRLAKESGSSRLILTHLPHFGDITQLSKEAGSIYKGPVQLAEKGLILEV